MDAAPFAAEVRRSMWAILPDARRTLLLRAALCEPESARAAWDQWAAGAGGLRRTIAGDHGLRSLLPLLSVSLRRAGVTPAEGLGDAFDAAAVREGLRRRTILRLTGDAVRALEGIDVLLAGDVALAETGWPDPSLRHCEGVELRLARGDISRAADLLTAGGQWRSAGRPRRGAAAGLTLAHESGLRMGLHDALLTTPHYADTLADVRGRAVELDLGGVRVAAVSPADGLLAAVGHMLVWGNWRSLKSACDAFMLARGLSAGTWAVVVESARRNSLAPALAGVLNYLADELGAAVPAEVRAKLAEIGMDRRGREAIRLGSARVIRLRGPAALRDAPDGGARVFAWRCALAPWPGLVRWAYGAAAWRTPLFWLLPPLKLAARALIRRRPSASPPEPG
ncbi:MAG: hypothetical protein BIFFINMI_03613 [Phycisphaerae bacterium]|nr:hypothetical protein [Phycisphaerae bacterium]